MTQHQKVLVFGGLCGLFVTLVFVLAPPVAQDPAYHHFSDARGGWGIPNVADVLSNAPFLVAGLYGLWMLGRRGIEPATLPMAVYFIGVMLVAPGSAYYHWAPDNATLFWDRLPMTVAFMGFFAAVIAERIDAKVGVRYVLPLLLVLGVASVVYWRQSELAGAGDLRAYAVVQFLPLFAVPLLLGLFPTDHAAIGWRAIAAVLLFYGLAKGAEHFDAEVLDLLAGAISGHTLKHLLAAASPVALVMNLRR